MKYVALLVFLLPTLGICSPGQAGPYGVELVTDPAVVPVGKATLDLFVTDAAKHPVEGAEVRAIAQMPNMAMGETEQRAVPTGVPGHYRMSQSFSMEGGYEARVAVKGPAGGGTAVISLETGKSTATREEGANPVPALWPWLLAVVVLAIVVVRMRKTGQRVRVGAVLNRQVVSSVLLLGAVALACFYAIGHFRRSGSMTPIEAQTMNMDMPPPEGVTPVTLATAKTESFGATATYAGQAVGYEEIDVSARTTGVIVWMPGYVGTAVKKGEVIARLDTTQLGPQVESQRAMVESARQGVGVARSESHQAEAMIHQAESELGQFQGAVEEAKANLAAAKDDQKAVRADVAAAQADVWDAEASASSAQANQQYWVAELKRESSLLAAGAVSRDEYEKEKSETAKADAAARQANEGIRSAQAKVEAAEARARKGDSMVVVAQRKIDQAQSALMAHHAHVLTAKAEASSAEQKVGQAQTGVRQAEAGLAGTTAQASYAEIRAEIDGVITQRIASPGSLVAPGQALLRIARIEPIRVQANVPEAQLAQVRVGMSVSILHRDASSAPAIARVSSVSPSVDPTSRTGIVEAVLANRNHAYLPGQFVSVVVPLGVESKRVAIPIAAVQTSASSGDSVQAQKTTSFVWLAVPSAGPAHGFTVARRPVVLGPAAGERISILSGLAEGDQVVVVGATGLSEGQTVTLFEKGTVTR